MRICQRCGAKAVGKNYKTGDFELFEKEYPKGTRQYHGRGQKVLVDGLKPDTILFYFGTHPSKGVEIPLRINAYEHLENSGVTKSDQYGTATLYLKCPQVYRNPEDKKVYTRHFHFLYWGKNEWERQLYSRQIFCEVSQSEVTKSLKQGTHIVVNALPVEEYKKKHIKGSISLPVDEVTEELVEERVMDALISYPIVLDAILKKKISFKEVPMILYCYSPMCNAAEKLKEKLDSLGFYNTWHYAGGISQWSGPVNS
jgi:rhodanese-related sulfurtransferase